MTDRQRRIEKLVRDVRVALDRGAAPERIHAELVRRRMPPDKATLLLERVLATMAAAARPTAPPGVVLPPLSEPPRPPRRRWLPAFLGFACTLLLAGTGGILLESEPAPAANTDAHATRLALDVAAARTHMEHLEARLEARKVDAEQIEWLRARVARGPDSFESDDAYAAMVARYQRRRAAWNRTLPDWQVVSGALRTLADVHNAKVDSLSALPGARAYTGASPARSAVRYTRIAAQLPPR